MEKMNYINDPQAIERESFRIITEELGENLPAEEIRDIVLRIIHTTADFEYAQLIEFKNDAVNAGLKALSEGSKIYADTSMIRNAVNSRALGLQGCEIVSYVHDEDVREEARALGITRSAAAMKKALNDGDVKIFAIGNAPTALYTLIEQIEAGSPAPELIVGAPIGFVGAAESKAALDRLDEAGVPYIRINGRKGGSPVAAAILNALLFRLGMEW